MSVRATRFLTALAKAVSTMILYRDGHPSRERVVEQAHDRLRELQEEAPRPRFTFLDDEVVLDRRLLLELKGWEWGPRLSGAGVQRLEFTGAVDRADFESFLEDLLGRLTQLGPSTAEVRQGRVTNIRYGRVDVAPPRSDDDSIAPGQPVRRLRMSLREESDAVSWLHEELKMRGELHLVEAESIVRSLTVAMHGDQAFLMPLLRLKRSDQYTTTHALNVSVLAMALAEYLSLGPREVRAFGIAGLLHDLGKTRVPDEILNKPGKLTPQEREVMSSHTVEGARIILETEDDLDLAATVAYEHHIKLDGGGYPSFKYHRICHPASDLVHVCDVYDALRTHRPYRGAWDSDRVLDYIKNGAGTEFNPNLAHAFVRMMRAWEDRIAELEHEDELLPGGEEELELVEDSAWGEGAGPGHRLSAGSGDASGGASESVEPDGAAAPSAPPGA